MRRIRSSLLGLLLASGCVAPSTEPEPEPPTPPVIGDDDDSAPVGDDDDSGTTDPCDSPLAISAEWPAVEQYGLLHVTTTGGSGGVTLSLDAAPSGGILNPVLGTYIAGDLTGVTDIVRAVDSACGDEVTLSIDVVTPLAVQPSDAQVLPGDGFSFSLVGGSGEAEFTATNLGSGGSLDLSGAYVAGLVNGLDEAEVTDSRTGVSIPLFVDVSSNAALLVAPARLAMPLGAQVDPGIQGGSGVFDFTPSAPGVVTSTSTTDGLSELLADGPGRVTVLVEDRYASLSTELDIDVVATRTAPMERTGSTTFRAFAQGPGDIDGDGFPDAVLGVMESNVEAARSGAIYVYAGGPNGLEPTPARVISFPEWFAEIGEDFVIEDLDGDGLPELVTGATRVDADRSALGLPPNEDAGVVLIYSGISGGFWSTEPTAALFGQYGSDYLGKSLAVCDLNGDGFLDIAAGARYAEDRSQSPIRYNAGGVYIYLGDGTNTWPELPDQTIFGVEPDGNGGWTPDASQEFGYDMDAGDIDGDGLCDLAVGSFNRGSGPGRSRDNLVTIWRGQADESAGAPIGGGVLPWPVLAFAPVDPETHESYFGREVRVADLDDDGKDDIIVSQYRFTDQSLSSVYHGALRIYEGRTLGSTPAPDFTPAATAVWTHTGTNGYDYTGAQMDIADVDGDGILDLLVGDTREEASGTPNDAGRVSVFLGQEDDFPETTASVEFYGEEGDGRMGTGVAALGDVDGDGLVDILGFGSFEDVYGLNVGAPWYFSGLDPTDRTLLDLPGEAGGQHFGESVSLVGDINSDGWEDLLVGAWEDTVAPLFRSGSAYLYLGSASGHSVTPDATIAGFTGHSSWDRLGYRVAPAGDFDGDGIDDFALLVRYEDKPSSFGSEYNHSGDCSSGSRNDAGAILVFRGVGASDPLPSEPTFIIYGPQASQRIDSLAGGGDFNGDGIDDLVFGGYDWDGPGANNAGGFAAVSGRPWSGNGIDVICTYDAMLTGANGSYRMGRDLTFIGDLEGDGCDDFAVGAYLADWTNSNEGAVHVVRGWGGSSCPVEATQAILVPQDANDQVGLGVGAGGDVDGDGIPDLAAGGHGWYGNGATRGSAWLIPGSWLTQVSYEPLDPAGTSAQWPMWPFLDSAREDWQIPGTDVNGLFGWDVTIVPDFANGRGALAVGAPRGNGTGEEWSGGVEVFAWNPGSGGLGRMSAVPVAAFVGESQRDGQAGAYLSSGTLGGSPVLTIGAVRSNAQGVDMGAAWVVEIAP